MSARTIGLVLAHQIKQDGDLSTIPIIVISSIGQSHGEDYARELGADDVPVEAFMDKPLDPRSLRETVRQVLETHS